MNMAFRADILAFMLCLVDMLLLVGSLKNVCHDTSSKLTVYLSCTMIVIDVEWCSPYRVCIMVFGAAGFDMH